MLSGLRKIWQFAGKERKNLNKSVFLEFIHALFNVLQIASLYLIIQALVTGEQGPAMAWKSFGLLVVSILGRSVVSYFSQLQQVHAGYFMVANKRISIASLLKTVPMGYFTDNTIGNITGVLTTVLDDVENSAPAVLVLMLSGFINSLVFTVMTLVFEWRIGLIVVIGSLLYLILTSRMERKSRQVAPQRQKAQAHMVETVLEQIQGMPVIKSFNLTGKGDKAVQDALEDSKRTNLQLEKLFTPHVMLQEIVLRLASVSMIVCGLCLYFTASIDLLTALMAIIMSFLVFASIQSAGLAMTMLRMATSSIEQAEEAAKMPQIDLSGQDIKPDNHTIEFKNVDFSYEKRPILRNISLKIPEKSLTAVVGPSGSGKTTLCSLISRFWDVDAGQILIGGHDIRDYTLESLMNQISRVFQNVYLFEDTIKNNIKFGYPEASDEEVIKAAQKAQCHDFIEKLPDGYDTVIDEAGSSLSGGEKQRIAIARAMLKDAPIIIFDEATANVDPENEDKLQAAIQDLTKDKTVIMIAHRLKTIRNADQIIVLNEGQIEQQGKHDELVQVEGTYRKFIEMRKRAETWRL